jgi:hypothetical protein
MSVKAKRMIKDGLWVGVSYAVMVGILSWHDNPDESAFSKAAGLIFQGVSMAVFFGLTFRPAFNFVSRHISPHISSPKEKSGDPGESS